ncbi:MAG: sugar ABC transporter substrate-binding protein [Clostridiales Family XIII bacterium]|jgi:ABC-type sugar transport system substrate-binding protein|nr:sugar ABC transporter substrate-binding protein [Clostridiales Family XIII bacterium]
MKKVRTSRFLAVVMAVLMMSVAVFALAACEKESDVNTDTPVAGDDTDITMGTTKVDIYNTDVKLLYVPIGDAGPAFEMARYAIEDTLKFLPNVTVDIKPAEYDPTKQADIITDAIGQGYQGIFFEAMDPIVSQGPIEKAEAAGIPVITVNLNSQAVHTLFIQGNDYKSGYQAGEILGAAIDGKGNALTLNAPAAQAATSQMIPGFQDALKDNYPDITFLEDFPCEGWQSSEAANNMKSALTKYDKIDIVYAASDDLADGAINAIKEAGRENEIKVYGSMGYPQALQRIKDGTQFGSYFADGYSQFQVVVYQMLYYVQNGLNATVLGYTDTPTLDMPTTPITKDGNLAGSVSVDQVIENSRWKVVMPDAFK